MISNYIQRNLLRNWLFAITLFTTSYSKAQPNIASFFPVTGSVGSLVTISGSNLSNPTNISIGGVAAVPISNNGSTLVAMVMPGASTGVVSISTAEGTANGSSHFTVISSLVPNNQQGSKLIGAGAVGIANQGYNIALSADGNTAIIGGNNDDGSKGAAWIFTRNDGTWTQQGNKLVGSGAIGNANQGTSVAISADGNTAIIGGNNDDGAKGAVWVFTRNGSTWSQQGNKLVGSGAIGNAQQGYSVAISADGNILLVGGHRDDGIKGAAWIFVRNGNTWNQQGNKLVGSGGTTNVQMGISVALSRDGSTAIIGGNQDDGNRGAAWIFTRSGNNWTQQGNKLVGSGALGNSFQGYSVSLSADGNIAIIGGYGDDGNKGAAWIFSRSGNNWTQQGNKLTGTGAVGGASQGSSVALSADGSTAIIGGYQDDGGKGAAWIFTRVGNSWVQQGIKISGNGTVGSASQGNSVAISADGNTALIGGTNDDGSKGALWVFTPSPPTISSLTPTAAGAGAILTITGTNLTRTYSITLGGTPVASFQVLSSTSISAVVAGGATGAISLVTPAGTATFGGFSFISPPTITNFSPSIGTIGTLVTITGFNLNNLTGLTIGGIAAIPISNDGNTLVAMVMPGANTGIISITTVGGSINTFSKFAVIPTSPPNTQQGNKLVGSGSVGNALQGWSVSVSANGNTSIIGGYTDDGSKGAVWVYSRNGNSWTQQGNKLIGSGALGNAFQGYSVSLSADGNTAIIGGYGDDGNKGAAWIFTRIGNSWIQQGNKVVGSGAIGNAQQGFSVAISADGNTALIGGNNDDGGKGAAWVFTRSGNSWTQQGSKIIGTGFVGNAQQGFSVALSADGNTALIGGVNDDGNKGAVWVFVRNASTWSQQGTKLIGSGAVGNSNQGYSVAINADGKTAILGAINDDSGKGAAWVFARNTGAWVQQGNKLIGTGAVGNAGQGFAVGVSADGNTAFIGGNLDDSQKGATWIFSRNNGSWTQQGNKLVGTGSTGIAQQGNSIALSADGNTVVLGGRSDSGNVGAAWVFTPALPTISSFTPTASGTGAILTITGTNLSATYAITLGGTPVASFQVLSPTSISAIVASGASGAISLVTTAGTATLAGFSFIPPPTITSLSPDIGPVGTLVTITGNNLNNLTGLTIGGVAAIPINNDGNTLVAMVMPGASTSGVSISTIGGKANGISNFTLIPSLPPSAQQGTKLVGNGAIGNSFQGASVSLSADGNTALIGGGMDNGRKGAAWVFIRNGYTWAQQENKLVGSDAVGNAGQGVVALSADGNTALIGGPNDDGNKGASWVFVRNGITWTQQGNKLVGSGAVGNSYQGRSIALSGDGNTAIIGSTDDDGGKGSAWIFTRNGSTWTQQGNKLVGTGAVGNAAQGIVAISADGNTVIIGGAVDNGGKGAAWIFTRKGSNWEQQGTKLVGNGAVGNAAQGSAVAISADGNTAIIGGWNDDGSKGAAWIFTRTGSNWQQQGTKLVGSGAIGNAGQGIAVAISADGNTAFISGDSDDGSKGATWIFIRSGNIWTQQAKKLVGSGAVGNSNQGRAIALSADGKTAIIGGYVDDSNKGAAWIFTPTPPTISRFTPTTAGTGAVLTITGTNLIGTTAITLGGTSVTSFNVLSSTTITAVVGAGTTGAISLTTAGGMASLLGFSFVSAPTISSFTPTAAGIGDLLTITGTNLNGATAITLGGTSVASFKVLSSTTISAIVGSGTSGAVSLTTLGGTASLSGFSFVPAPTITNFSPNIGPVGTLVTISGSNLNNFTSLTIGGVSAIPISNNGNTLVAMVMPGTANGRISITTVGGTAIGNNNFTLIPSLPPNTQQGNKLVGTGSLGNAQQGQSISISADGNTAIVGGNYDDGNKGAAWIFTRSGSSWLQQGNKLVGTGGIGNAEQGISVAISADGNTAIVGGYQDDGAKGAVWVFTRNGNTWSQQGNKLVGSGAIGNAQQGNSVAISADGNIIVSGGYSDDGGKGAVWIFTRNGISWTQLGSKLVGSGAAGNAQQGNQVAVSADGNTVLIGGYYDNGLKGAAWIFNRTTGGNWTQQGNKLVGTGAIGNALQGHSVALSANGNTAIIGGATDDALKGAAWIFSRSGDTWTQQGPKLIGTGAIGNSKQGCIVALSADGNMAIIGGNRDDSNKGAAWIFTRIDSIWTQQGIKIVGTGSIGNAQQSGSIAISADGNTAIIGGPNDDASKGAAWVFKPTPPTISSFTPTAAGAGAILTITGTNLIGTTAISIGGTPVASFNVLSSTTLTAIVGSGASGSVSLSSAGGIASLSGFSFIPAPTITNFSPNIGPVGTLVTISGNNLNNFITLTIGGVAAIPISNNGNTLVAMVMPGAINGGISITTFGGTANGNSNFTLIPSLVPNTQQGNKLVGTGAVGNAKQAYQVALSADGNTAILGGTTDNGNKGAAWIFSRIGSSWIQQGNKLIGSGAIGNAFQGTSVALSADGNTAIVGGSSDNGNKGAAWVFVRNGISWTQQGNKLVGSDVVGYSNLGISASLSADGNTAIIGGYGDDGNKGAAWVFTRMGNTWTQQGNKLVGSGAVGNSQQGNQVALSSDGNTAVVGGFNDNGGKGAAWIFARNGGLWTQQGNKLIGTGDIGNAYQSSSVALSADGNTAIIGGFGDDGNKGAAWIFSRNGITWTQQGSKLVGIDALGNARMGNSAALSADGNTLIIGGNTDNESKGAIWVFNRNGSSWTQQGNKFLGSGAIGNAEQGVSIAISADGNTALVGGPIDDASKGAAWIFIPAPPIINSFTPTAAGAGAILTITGNNLIGTTTVTLGGTSVVSFNVISSTTLTAIVGSGASGSVNLSTAGGSATLSGFSFIPAPSISSFTPTRAASGASITITGNNLSGTTSITLGETPVASFNVLSSNTITAVVGSGSSGAVSLITAGGKASLSGFSYIPTPTISAFTPTSAGTGAVITITGTNLLGTYAISLGGIPVISFEVLSSTCIVAVVGNGASGAISLVTSDNTATLDGFIYIPPPPTISNFTPTIAKTGDIITITGTNLTGTTSISLGGIQVVSFTVISATTIQAEVGSGSSGALSLETPGGRATINGFSYIFPIPTITSFTPTAAGSGTVLTIMGTNLSGTSTILLGGTRVSSFTIVSSTTINAIVGSGSSGSISLVTPGGTASLSGFSFIPAPTITNFTPVASGSGGVLTITGTNLIGTNAITLGGTSVASFTIISANTIITVVGSGSTGAISLVTLGGTATLSGFRFIPAPSISGFSPKIAGGGSALTITGSNFEGTTSVIIGGTPASSFTVLSPTSIRAVIGNGNSGSIAVVTPGGQAQLEGFTFVRPDISINYQDSIQVFGATKGANSKVQNYTISGSYLQGDILVVASDSFQISQSSNSGFVKNILLKANEGKIDSTKIYIRYRSTLLGTKEGSIVHTSTNAVSKSISITGNSGCDSTVYFTPVINNFSKDTLICFKDSVILSPGNSLFTVQRFNLFKWNTGELSRDIIVKNSGIYKLQVGLTSDCMSYYSVPVRLNKNTNPIPTISLSNDNLISSNSSNYRWFYNNLLISTAITNTLKPNKTGFYTVETSNDSVCWEKSIDFALLNLPNTMIKDSIVIKVYPNPTSSGLFHIAISLTNATNIATSIAIVDGSGNIIYQTNKFIFLGREVKIPITLAQRGTFYATININGIVKVIPVIIQ